jgi:hypothetical protein
MNHRKSVVAIAIVAGFLASSALAQQTGGDQHHPAGPATAQTAPGMPMSGMAQGMPGDMKPGSGAMPMMGMMQTMGQDGMGAMMARHIEGRIAFLKAELKITDAQQTLWNAVADVMRSDAKSMGGMAMMGAATLPDKLASREKTLAARLDQLRKLTAVVEPLYAAFDSDQKKTADELMSGPMGIGMMGMGMM